MRDSSGEAFEHEVDDFLRFTGVEPLKPRSIFILVMGITGSGKSTFVSRCTGTSLEIGHDLMSCTQSLSIVEYEQDDYTVYLVDTPGFDDTNVQDIDTLKTLAHYLSVSYGNGVHISGIVYLHRISDNRVSGASKRNMDMLKALVGPRNYDKVAIATTMWSNTDYERGCERERELVSSDLFLKDLRIGGAAHFRHAEAGTGATEERESAREIVSHLIGKQDGVASVRSSIVLQIQREMVDQEKNLDETQAAQILLGDLLRARREFQEQLALVQSEMNEASRKRDLRSKQLLEEAKDEFRLQLEQTEAARASLATSLLDMQQAEQDRLLRMIEDMNQQWNKNLINKRREVQELEESLQLLRQDQAPRTGGRSRQDQVQMEIWALQELRNVQRELEDLRKDVNKKKESTTRIRSNLTSGIANGVAGAVVTGMLGAGLLCIVS